MDKLFSLLKYVLDNGNGNDLPSTAEEWKELYAEARKQSLTGICFAGVDRLPESQLPPAPMVLKWIGQAEYIKTRNSAINQQCVELQKVLSDAGFDSCVLKGQGVGSLYKTVYSSDLAEYRMPGDIDIWIVPRNGKAGNWVSVMDYVNSISPNREFDGKHTHLNIFHDTTVEVHWWPSVSSNVLVSRKLKNFYREQTSVQCHHKVHLSDGQTIIAASPFFDSIHVLWHIYGHFLYEGIGLRQVMDYYFVVIQEEVQSRRDEIVRYYKDFGIYDFSRSVMYVMHEAFGLEPRYFLTEPDERTGRELLSEIMSGGNFGASLQENHVRNESFCHRMVRRAKRKLRLVKYDPVGVLCSPFYKVNLLIWKSKVIKHYNL